MTFEKRKQCQKGMEILDAVYDIAVNNSDIWETANQLANEYLEKNNRDVKTASAEMVNFVQTNCTGTEFLNHIGKQMSIDAVIPAYEAGNLCVQITMITALAIMGGYDPHKYLIKTLVLAALVGMTAISISKHIGEFIGNKITVQALENTPEKSLKKINQTIGYNFVVVMCKNGINVVPKAPDYESGVVEPFDRNSVKKVAERAAEVFLQIKYLF